MKYRRLINFFEKPRRGEMEKAIDRGGKMRKIIGVLLLSGMLLWGGENDSLVFKTIGVAETFYLPVSSENGYTINISFTWPDGYKDPEILKKLQRQFLTKNFGEDYADMTAEEALQTFYRSEVESYKEENGDIASDETWSLAWEYHSENKILFHNADILQYAINYWQFSGGAHGTGGTSYSLLDLKTGNELSAADIFKAGTEDKIRELIIPGLLTYWEAKSLDDVVDEDGKKDLMDNLWQPGTNFGVTATGIIFSYSDYELGYYALGQPESLVPWEKILPCLREDSPVWPVAAAGGR